MDDHARWLVDRQQVIVLKENVESALCGFHRRAGDVGGGGDCDSDDVARREPGGDAANGMAIDADGAILDPDLHSCPSGRIEVCEVAAKHEIESSSRVAAISGERADRHLWRLSYPRRWLRGLNPC
jgi:hypothetical protein